LPPKLRIIWTKDGDGVTTKVSSSVTMAVVLASPTAISVLEKLAFAATLRLAELTVAVALSETVRGPTGNEPTHCEVIGTTGELTDPGPTHE
jgi:hypothetical protein